MKIKTETSYNKMSNKRDFWKLTKKFTHKLKSTILKESKLR